MKYFIKSSNIHWGFNRSQQIRHHPLFLSIPFCLRLFFFSSSFSYSTFKAACSFKFQGSSIIKLSHPILRYNYKLISEISKILLYSLCFSTNITSASGDAQSPSEAVETAVKVGNFTDPVLGFVVDTAAVSDTLNCDQGTVLNPGGTACGEYYKRLFKIKVQN